MKIAGYSMPWVALILFSPVHSAVRKCTTEDNTRALKPGQCLTQCAGSDGKVTCPGDPPVTVSQDDCDFLTVVRDSNGEVIDRCCTSNPEKPSKKRPQCGKNVGWLECDPDNGFGSCCSKEGLCGSGEEYCGLGNGGSNSKCDKCPKPRNDKRCGKDFNGTVCPEGQCCSGKGWCGTTDNHCKVENGCQGTCKPSGPGANRCGAQAGGRTCDPDGEFGGCCSQKGFCGTSPAHCDKNRGCQSGCERTERPAQDPQVQKPLKPKPTDSGDKNEDEDPDEPSKTPSGRKGDDEDPDSPSKTPSQEDNGNDPDVDDPKKCAPCPACPKTECPPPPRKNPASSPKFEPNAPNTIRACLCDEGEEPVVHKLAPQKLGCNWKNGQQVTIGGQNFVYECYLWQLSPHTTTVEGGSLEQCGEICSATKGCQSTNFWHSNMKMDGKESCTLLMRPVGNPSQSKPDPLSDQSVFGGSLRGL